MTEEEYFRKNFPDSCYGDRPLSPHWDFFEDGVEFGERQSKKKIKELEKENTELKGSLELYENGACRAENQCAIKDQLSQAKELLKKILATPRTIYRKDEDGEPTPFFNPSYEELEKQAEQFLNGEKIILEDAQAGNSPFDADEVFNKEMKAYPEEKVK